MNLANVIREPYVRALGLVSAAHFMSHYLGMLLPPLLPFLHADLGVSYTLLGILLSVKTFTTGVLQLPAGIAVDKVGAKAMLFMGLLICAVAVIAIALTHSLYLFVFFILLFGVGNSVFHPTDFSILNSSMPEHLMGRSFSFHTFSGHLGSALAPVVVLTITAIWDWRTALIASGVTGLIVAAAIGLQWGALKDGGQSYRKRKAATPNSDDHEQLSTLELLKRIVSTPAILYLFLFFCMSSLAGGGLKNFAVAGLVALHNTPLAAAGGAASGFLFASALGVLLGGYVADQTNRHDLVAAASLTVAALILVIIGAVNLHYTVLVFCFTLAGMVNGLIRPARDMMIRNAAPRGSAGKVFGFIYSGQSVGSTITPLIFGLMLDFGHPAWIFYTSAIFTVFCLAVILLSGRAARAANT